MTASTAPKKTVYVLVDRTVPPKGVPARSCFWDKVLLNNPPDKLSISDSREELRKDPAHEPVRIDMADIVIVNWDAANGDYACGSDDVYLYFLTREDRRTALLGAGGILLCEFQSGKGVLHQGAYDVIFGKDEVTVYKAKLGQVRKPASDEAVRTEQELNEAKSHGAKASVFHRYEHHPLAKELPQILKSEFKEDGDHIFNFSETFTAFQAYQHRESQLWRSWFENWKKGWVPLLVALPQTETPHYERPSRGMVAVAQSMKSRFDRWFRFPPAILLAKTEGKGLMLASTMWIAGARCQVLVDQILKPDVVTEIRKAHRWISIWRGAGDSLMLALIAAGYAWLLWQHISVKPSPSTRLGVLLGGAEDVGFAWLALILLRFWSHFLWRRPYGATFFQFFQFARKSFWETL